jgi:hypothetical protein
MYCSSIYNTATRFERDAYPGGNDAGAWPLFEHGVAPRTDGALVQPVDVYEFIEFGIAVQTIRWFPSDRLIGRDRSDFAESKKFALASFRERWLDPRGVGLDLIDSAISELTTALTIEQINQRTEQMGVGPVALDWTRTIESTRKAINDLLVVLQHECHKFPILSVAPVRAFDTTVMMTSAERVLSDSSQKRLSDFWRDGWREAGRCLLFDAPTAATYQILRVTESVIKRYRKAVTGQDATDSDTLSDHISALKHGGVGGPVIAALQALKNVHRNPMMHPGPNATQDEAVSLFGVCASVIDCITADMDSRERSSAAKAGP